MKRKLFAVLLAATMMMTAFVGCGEETTSVEPTAVPTEAPVTEPTAAPTEVPVTEPTATPTEVPVTEPTAAPTEVPVTEPTAAPTEVPVTEPTEAPVTEPTVAPEASEEADGDVKTEVVVGDYKNMVLNSLPLEEADAVIAEEMEAYAEYVPVEREAREGDTVNINYVGTLNGVAFEGGTDDSEEGYDLTLGSGTFIEGFEEGLIGAKSGEVRDLHLTFPENYQSAELAGQAVVFTVTVNEVCEYVVPELTDEFAQNYLGVESAAELWDAAYAILNEEHLQNQAVQLLMENSELVKYSEEEMEAEAQYTISYYLSYAEYYSSYFGADVDTMLAYLFGFMSRDALVDYAYDYAYQSVKLEAVLAYVAEAEKIELNEEEFEEYVKNYAAENEYSDTESFLAEYGEEYVREISLQDKVIKTLVEMSTIVPAE